MYNAAREECALREFPYAIPNPDQGKNGEDIQFVLQEDWVGYYLVIDNYMPSKGIRTFH